MPVGVAGGVVVDLASSDGGLWGADAGQKPRGSYRVGLNPALSHQGYVVVHDGGGGV